MRPETPAGAAGAANGSGLAKAAVKIQGGAGIGVNGKIGVVAEVLSAKRYAGIAAGGAAGVGLAYYFLTMPMLAAHFGAAAGLAPSHLAASLGLTAAVSALAGINFALIAYRISAARQGRATARGGSQGTATTVLGGAAAAFTPGCPACTAPLAVLLGAVGGLSLLPMQGIELKILSAGVLLFSVYWVARKIERGSAQCRAAAPAVEAGMEGEAAGGGERGCRCGGGGGGGLDAGPRAAGARD